MKIENKKILFIGAHPDDIEIGCGGTMFKLKEKNEIHCHAFTSASEKDIPEQFLNSSTIRLSPFPLITPSYGEFYKSMDLLKPAGFNLYDIPVRNFPKYRQRILDILCDLLRKLNPDIVFTLSTHDTHQDHKTIHEESYRAFKNKTLITYEMPRNNNTAVTYNYGIALEEQQVKDKLKLLDCYDSQKWRSYFDNDLFLTILKYQGLLIGTKYAEFFTIIKTTDK